MNKDRNALKAGTFIVASVVVVAGIIVAIKDFGQFAEPAQVRFVRFKLTEDLGGLRVGDELRVGGFKVGSVKSIEPDDLNGVQEPTLLVTFTIPKKYPLREGASVGIQSGLTGATNLNVFDLGRGQPLPDGAVIVGIGDPKGRLLASLGEAKVAETVEAFKKTATTATETIAQVKGQIDPAFDKYAKIADPAGEAVTKVRDLVDEARPKVNNTLANLDSATGTVKEKIPETMQRVNSTLAKVEASVDKLQTSLEDVKAALANTKDLTASARSLVVGNRSRIDGMVAGAKAASDNLKAATAEIRRSPWRLLYKPAKGEMANLNLYDAARQFAEGANDMSDAATALRDALASKDVDEKVLRTLVARLDKSFDSFQQVEKTLWERVKE
jgi:phospholipid/cholesterol/gamma-HCH transport system substrate-binding protein